MAVASDLVAFAEELADAAGQVIRKCLEADGRGLSGHVVIRG